MNKRVFLIILDSVGCGAAKDAADYGDVGTNTIRSASGSKNFHIPNMISCGLANIPGVEFLGTVEHPSGAYGRLQEQSKGKDTTSGHWELAGAISPKAMPTYPDGFPKEILDAFTAATGRGVLCNKPYSGTEVIKDYGREHLETGKLIVYTSADSVFQIAAHEDLVPLEELYDDCRKARAILQGEHGVGRVIARPFIGDWPYTRTSNRHDFSLTPPRTMLNAISDAGMDVIGVGKIYDIFAGSGVTETHPTKGNTNGLQVTLDLAKKDFHGLCFVNLVDFDMLYGHRQDPDGYAAALTEFDQWLPKFLDALEPDDIVMISADHGCDPCDDSTDHTRENVPLLVLGQKVKPVALGMRDTFADVASSICEILGVEEKFAGTSFAREILE